MKDLISYIKESKSYNDNIFQDLAEKLVNDKDQLSEFIKNVKKTTKTDDWRGYVSDYEPMRRRNIFTKCEDIDSIVDNIIEIIKRFDADIDELLDNCPGAKNDNEKWSDICQRLVNKIHNINKNILKSLWK